MIKNLAYGNTHDNITDFEVDVYIRKQTYERIEDGISSQAPIKNFFITYQSASFGSKRKHFLAEIIFNTILNYLNKVIKA